MATQLQKYNGNNFYNNRIEVDFVKKGVKFEPVVDGSFFKYYFGFFINHVGISIMPIYIGCILLMIIDRITQNDYITLIQRALYICLGTSIIISFIASLKFFNKDWRTNNYPKYNAKMVILRGKLFSLGLKKGYRELKINNFKRNIYVLKDFENVFLDYKLKGDCGKFIQKIVVDNEERSKRDVQNWTCMFIFKKIPEKGELIVRYV